MIERLTHSLRTLARADVSAVSGRDLDRAAGDFADALRLTLDCPQIRLGASDRAALLALEAELDRLERARGGVGAAAPEERTSLAARARSALTLLAQGAENPVR